MTAELSTPVEPVTQNRTITVISIIVLCVFAFSLGIMFPFIVGFHLLAGWILYVRRVLPTLTISVGQTFWFLIFLLLFTVVLHRALKKIYRWKQESLITLAEQSAVAPWQKRWTFTLVTLFLMLALSGISVTSMTHQGWWMATGKDQILVYHTGSRAAARRSTSKNNLKQIGLAMHGYHDSFRQLPAGGTFDSTGQPHHGWVAQLLPYLDQGPLLQQIDFNQPWNAEVNRKPFQTRINMIYNPGIVSDYDTGKSSKEAFQGYQPAHYAANSQMFSVNTKNNFRQIKDGSSNTIFAGKIKANIKPWGDPRNFRDPGLGINRSARGFGSPFVGGANFLMGDGSVRFLSEDIDPAVLKALSTPNGGEPVGEY